MHYELRYKNNSYNNTTSIMSGFSFLSVILPLIFIIIYNNSNNEKKNRLEYSQISSEIEKTNTTQEVENIVKEDNFKPEEINVEDTDNNQEQSVIQEEMNSAEESNVSEMSEENFSEISEVQSEQNKLKPILSVNSEKLKERDRYIKQADELVQKGYPKVAYGYYNAAQAIQFTEDIDLKMKEILK